MNIARTFVAGCFVFVLSACDSVYYGAMEQIGFQKSDLMRSSVEDAMEAQADAKEEFQSAFERFSSVVTVERSELRDTYDTLNDAYEDADSKARRVTERIEEVEDVSEDLFAEWEQEIGEISSADLRRSSQRQLSSSRKSYAELMRAMRRAESRMAPVLTAFKDQVLFLKHNLNAQAIASLKSELGDIETDVAQLIREMESAIEKSQAYIEELEG